METRNMNDIQWVNDRVTVIEKLLDGTILEVYFRNGHSQSQYLKFKDERFNLQIRVSNHQSKRWRTKFQLLRCVNFSKPRMRKDGNVWIWESVSPIHLVKTIALEYHQRGKMTREEYHKLCEDINKNHSELRRVE